MFRSVRWMLGVIAAMALVAAGCGGDDDGDGGASKSGGPVTIEWWHIQNNDPMKTIWADAAKQYEADHPNVKIKITVLENEAFKTKLTTIRQPLTEMAAAAARLVLGQGSEERIELATSLVVRQSTGSI